MADRRWVLHPDGAIEFDRPLDRAPGWTVGVRFEMDGERMEIRRIEIKPTTDTTPGGINRDLLRAVSTGDLRREAAALLRPRAGGVATSPALESRLRRVDHQAGGSLDNPRRGRGRQVTDMQKARRAATYIECLDEAAPVKEFARREHLSAKSAPAILHQLRRDGFLTSPGRGVAGGDLTDKSRALLDDEPKD